MKYEYKTHAAYRGYGWIEPLMDSEDALIADYLASRICEELNALQAENEKLRKNAEKEQQSAPDVADYEQVLDDHRRLTRELDVLLNGEEGAAQQASLADLVAQLRTVVRKTEKPVLAALDVAGLVEAIQKEATSLCMETELRALFELIDAEDFAQAREKIAALEQQLGEHEPELTRARSLITFLEGSE